MAPCLPLLLAGLLAAPVLAGPTWYVAKNGQDRWSGTLAAPNKARTDGPFATLERARDEVRKRRAAGPWPAGGVTIEVLAGVYELAQPFVLTAQDSGQPGAPVVYRARAGAAVRLVGGKVVGGWQPVKDPAILARLDPAARSQVRWADLRAQGVEDLGTMATESSWSSTNTSLELFYRDLPMTLARWPNEGMVKIPEVLGPTVQDIRGTKGCKEGIFRYEGDRPGRWVDEPEGMLHGYWFWDWAEQRYRIESIDPAQRVITLSQPDHAFGYRKNQEWYAFNLLCELDQPGEWYLDRAAGRLYFWPPAPLQPGQVMVSVLPSLVTSQGTSDVTLRGFILEGARGTAVTVSGGSGVQVVGCTIRNVGGWGVSASGTKHRVAGCDLYHLGQGGLSLAGGDRATLTPGELSAENNHIHHYSRWKPVYRPGVTVSGVGNRIAHNLIHNAPHMAIGLSGNEHVIEYNEVHSVVYHSNDAGALYCGYDWGARGQIIRYNYFHDIYGYEGRGCMGVYLDDMFSSALIHGNLFCRVPRAAFIGGGRDTTIENNLFIDCSPAVHVDARGLGWAAGAKDRLTNQVKALPYQSEPWRSRYPQLLTLLDDPEAMAPEGNVIARNIQWGGRWSDFEGKAKPLITLQDNLLGEDPKLVDQAKLDFRLRPDSPAFKLGFKALPLEQMGLQQSPERASWPVQHTVRPQPLRPVEPPRPARGVAPVCRAGRLASAPLIDGSLAAGEWTAATELAIAQGVNGEALSPRSRVWVGHDGAALLIAFENTVEATPALRVGATWGQDDAVEVAVRVGPAPAPILVLRGFPGGQWLSSDEAEAPDAAVKRAAEAVRYAAKVTGPTQWVAEWRIPLASLAWDPAKVSRCGFNLAVRKTAKDQWLLWRGTLGRTWEVQEAGLLELAP